MRPFRKASLDGPLARTAHTSSIPSTVCTAVAPHADHTDRALIRWTGGSNRRCPTEAVLHDLGAAPQNPGSAHRTRRGELGRWPPAFAFHAPAPPGGRRARTPEPPLRKAHAKHGSHMLSPPFEDAARGPNAEARATAFAHSSRRCGPQAAATSHPRIARRRCRIAGTVLHPPRLRGGFGMPPPHVRDRKLTLLAAWGGQRFAHRFPRVAVAGPRPKGASCAPQPTPLISQMIPGRPGSRTATHIPHFTDDFGPAEAVFRIHIPHFTDDSGPARVTNRNPHSSFHG